MGLVVNCKAGTVLGIWLRGEQSVETVLHMQALVVKTGVSQPLRESEERPERCCTCHGICGSQESLLEPTFSPVVLGETGLPFIQY